MTLSLMYYLFGVIGSGGFLATFFFQGKKAYRESLIEQLKDLVETQEKKISLLTEQNEKQQHLIDKLDARCEYLEKLFRGDSELVLQGDLAYPRGGRRKSRPADPQRSKNGQL